MFCEVSHLEMSLMKLIALLQFVIAIPAFLFPQQRVTPMQVPARVLVYDHVGSIPETLLFTPKHDGVYQISVHSSVTAPSESRCHEIILPHLTYSDEGGSKQQTADLRLDISGLPGWRDSKFLIPAKAGSIISYRIEHVGEPCDAPGHYDFFMAVTLLSKQDERENRRHWSDGQLF
jgi:hypothetical protein